ncbi:MAG: nitrate/nitrite transporter NrtS [Syntrophales bacterium]
MKLFFGAALERGTVATSVKVALIVGSILALINYGDRILLHGNMRALDWFKLAATYCVPYCVATYGAARYATRHARDKRNKSRRDSDSP